MKQDDPIIPCRFCSLPASEPHTLCKPHSVKLSSSLTHLLRCRVCKEKFTISAEYIKTHTLPNCGTCSANSWALATATNKIFGTYTNPPLPTEE